MCRYSLIIGRKDLGRASEFVAHEQILAHSSDFRSSSSPPARTARQISVWTSSITRCYFCQHLLHNSSDIYVAAFYIYIYKFKKLGYLQLGSFVALYVAWPPSQREGGEPTPSACSSVSVCVPVHTAAQAFFLAVRLWKHNKIPIEEVSRLRLPKIS